MNTTITITTVHKPTFIENLCRNINDYGHKDTDILIIGDCKTPPIKNYCRGISKRYGIPIEYLDIEKQERELRDYPDLLDIIPYNTPDRVILGGMIAYLRGCNRLIAIDDDNFVTDSDFVGHHDIVGTTRKLPLIHNPMGWFNVHLALEDINGIEFYPRGYPFKKRNPFSKLMEWHHKIRRTVVNQGLVLGDPDIDAITRLAHPIEAYQMNTQFPKQFGLLNTWSPFNYQNTCLVRELIPCYFRPASGLRNADIWTAYIFNKLAEHFGDVITFGHPLVKQIRNEHNLFDDLKFELENNIETDYFVDLLKSIKLTKYNYFDALYELIIEAQHYDNPPMTRDFFKEYQIWCEVISEII